MTEEISAFRRSLRERAAANLRTIVFPEGSDPRTLDAAAVLVGARLVRPVLLGAPDALRPELEARGVPPDAVAVVDPAADPGPWATRLQARRAHRRMTLEQAAQHVLSPLVRGALMVDAGEVDGSVAGAANTTGDVLRAAFWCVGPADGIRTVSSSFYMGVPDFRGRGPEVLTFTDGAVLQYPTAPQLSDVAWAAAQARRAVVGDEPVVAFLSHSTLGSAQGSSVDRMRQALELFRSRHPEIEAGGEYQADAALVPEVAARKADGAPAAGRANVLVFPDLDAANIGYKLVQRLTGGEAIGPIVQGLRRPCNDLSRGATASDIVDVACVTALTAGNGDGAAER